VIERQGEAWDLGCAYAHGPTHISVIEPPDAEPPRPRTQPFGFSRALPAPDPDEDAWEGMGL